MIIEQNGYFDVFFCLNLYINIYLTKYIRMIMPEFISNTVQVHIVAFKANDPFFLVLKRAKNLKIYPSIWQVVTGCIETNETAIQTAIREIQEETGLIVQKFWVLPFVANFYDSINDLIHNAPVFGVLVDYNQKIVLSEEHEEFVWLNYNDTINRLEFPAHKDGTKIFYDYILCKNNNSNFLYK